ncbi:MAG: hypothetical protein ACI9MR_004525 [Myxococcota bacterium]|jgi:hypothetical protein
MLERRRFYRLRYPDDARPEDGLLLNGQWRALVELSECGVRVIADDSSPEVGTELDIEIKLPTGEEFTIEGARIVRLEGSEIVVVFDHGVPSETVFKEQRSLIRRARDLGDAKALAALRPPYMTAV